MLSAAFIFVLASMSFAHPPTSVSSQLKGDMLTVDIVHPVRDPSAHYIYEVVVKVNGKKVIEQFFPLQNGNEQKAHYFMPGLKPSDEIEIFAECNKGGSKILKTMAEPMKGDAHGK